MSKTYWSWAVYRIPKPYKNKYNVAPEWEMVFQSHFLYHTRKEAVMAARKENGFRRQAPYFVGKRTVATTTCYVVKET